MFNKYIHFVLIYLISVSLCLYYTLDNLWNGLESYAPSFSNEEIFYLTSLLWYSYFMYGAFLLLDYRREYNHVIYTLLVAYSIIVVSYFYSLSESKKKYKSAFYLSLVGIFFGFCIFIIAIDLNIHKSVWSLALSLVCNLYLISFTFKVKQNS